MKELQAIEYNRQNIRIRIVLNELGLSGNTYSILYYLNQSGASEFNLLYKFIGCSEQLSLYSLQSLKRAGLIIQNNSGKYQITVSGLQRLSEANKLLKKL